MRRLLRWLPGVLIGVVLGAGIYAVATGRMQLPRNTANVNVSATPSSSAGLHTDAAVIAAVKEYYRVTDIARGNGNVDLVDQVTFSIGSPANVNFREFMRQQEAKNRRSVNTGDYFSDWKISLTGDQAIARFKAWQSGYDIDAKTRAPVESPSTTTKGLYESNLRLKTDRWVLVTDTLLQDDVG